MCIRDRSSTKNKEKKRDPDAHQVKKGNTWHFGYKAHIGVDKDLSLIHISPQGVWTTHSGQYTVPAEQYETRFFFMAVSTYNNKDYIGKMCIRDRCR